MGKAQLFLSLSHYSKFFSKLLGSMAFPGTLNLRVLPEQADELSKKAFAEKKLRLEEKIIGEKKLGGVSCLRAKISNGKASVACLLVFPDKSTHSKGVLEVVAGENLRQKLVLADGSKVEISLETK